MADDPTPRLATEAEFDDMMTLVERSFAYERGGMEARLPYCYDRSQPERHAVIERDGRIVSHVAAVPQLLAVGGGSVECWGIGGVTTDKRYRGNGYMSILLEFWLDRMGDEGVPMSELGGNRQRYEHFGYETAGTECRYRITERSYGGTPKPCPDVNPLGDTQASLASLQQLHERDDIRVRRTATQHRMVQEQRGLETLVYTGDSGPAYVSMTRESRQPSITECGGSSRGVERLVSHVLAIYDIRELTVRIRPRHPLGTLFHKHSQSWTYRPHRQVRINDLLGVLRGFEAQLEARIKQHSRRPSASVTLAIDGGDEPVRLEYDGDEVRIEPTEDKPDIVLDRCSMTRLLFGFRNRMPAVKAQQPVLEAATPLRFFIWPSEHV